MKPLITLLNFYYCRLDKVKINRNPLIAKSETLDNVKEMLDSITQLKKKYARQERTQLYLFGKMSKAGCKVSAETAYFDKFNEVYYVYQRKA